jgi:hypothetical protein
MRGPFKLVIVTAAVTVALVGQFPALAVHGGDTEVTVGSNDLVFSQNKQNEPAVAIDPAHPTVVVAGANDNIDMEACNAGDPTTCPFTEGVGGTGIQFSFNSGDTWMQPTYTGYTARHCVGPPGFTCTPTVGPIGTVPWYYESGLVSDGDPALAFGPQPGSDGTFSWANGSRLYVANLTSNFPGQQAFKGAEAIAVSRLDGDPAITPAIAADKNSWQRPVIASKQSSARFSDKEQIWADNAESSGFFGNVYTCFAAFTGSGAAPLYVATSRDGGSTWANKQVSPAHNVAAPHWGQSGCAIRTDSTGVVYVFYEEFQDPTRFLPPTATHFMVRSFDGGRSWTRPQVVQRVTDPCFFVDPVIARCVIDGVAGARSDLAAAPSVDIANGAPTGAGATDEIVLAWVDGRDGQNSEDVMVTWSTNGGSQWSPALRVQNPASDRGYYAAPALSPDGRDLYVVYNAFTTPFREDTTSPRGLVGVVLHADVTAAGTPTSWSVLNRGAQGDPRASSQNNLQAEFLGDYVYAAATTTYAVAVWNDVRNGTDCPAIDTWRAALQQGETPTPPAPQVSCAPTFGNTDIFGGSYADPTTP